MALVPVLCACSVVLLSAHAAAACLDRRDVPHLLWPGVAAGVGALALELPNGSWRDYWRFGVQYHALGVLLGVLLECVDVYAVAVCAGFVLVYALDVCHARGLLRYDPTTASFVVSRAAAYGLVRVVSYVTARETGVLAVELLTPVALGLLETGGMAARGNEAFYPFAFGSRRFAVYAVAKSALLLGLPVLERALL